MSRTFGLRLLAFAVSIAAGCSGTKGQGDNPNGDASVGALPGDAACPSGSASAGPSCAKGGPGLNDCGHCDEGCCASLEVTGGTYFRTYTNSDGGPSGEADPATVSGFRLDEYEVTVGRFRQFVSAWNDGAGYSPPAGSGKHVHLNQGSGLSASGGGYEPGWDSSGDSDVSPTDAHLACDSYSTWTPTAGPQETLPINCLNWFEAYAFCIWDGGFLPSEAEWEYAAAGGNQQREYPWGSTPPGTTNQYQIYTCDYPDGSGHCSSAANVAPVGMASHGAGRWGQFNLAGNVEEWGLDGYLVPYAGACTDCAYLAGTTRRVLRGGSFFEFSATLLPPYRDASPPTDRSGFYGIRCARSPL